MDESKVDPTPWTPGKSYKNDYVEKYDNLIQEVCRENNVSYINLWEHFKKVGFEELLIDGLHPNSRGHKLIFDLVKSAFC